MLSLVSVPEVTAMGLGAKLEASPHIFLRMAMSSSELVATMIMEADLGNDVSGIGPRIFAAIPILHGSLCPKRGPLSVITVTSVEGSLPPLVAKSELDAAVVLLGIVKGKMAVGSNEKPNKWASHLIVFIRLFSEFLRICEHFSNFKDM